MKRINLYDAIEFKKSIKEQFDIDVHWHDSCGGQYFELETTNNLITEFIEAYFREKNIGMIFNDKKTEFRLVEIEQC